MSHMERDQDGTMFASKVCREFSKKTKAQRLWVCKVL